MTLITKRETLPKQKVKHQMPLPRTRLQYMSPASQKKRKLYAQYQRTNSLRKLVRYEASEVDLGDEQNAEMSSIVEATQPDELEKLFKEGDQCGVCDVLNSIWLTDKNCQKNEFSHDQEHNSELGLIMAIVYHVLFYLKPGGRGNW